MSYEVLARKYRPKSFDELTGQDSVARVLRGAIEQKRLGHAFLFTGPRGVGKTSTARILACALNCLKVAAPTAEPCGQCESCRAIAAGNDVDVVEIDGASNRKIDDIRALREQVGYAPMRSRYKIYIIDEVHQLTSEAFNALLKTLEEPPAHVKFFFATTEVEKVPETIRSRCQIHEFHRIRDEDIAQRLKEVAEAEQREVSSAVLEAIAGVVRGGMRDAQTLLDQLLAMGPEAPTLEDFERISGRGDMAAALAWLQAAEAGDSAALLRSVAEALERGRREEDLIDELATFLRELMLLRVLGAETDLAFIPRPHRKGWIALLSALEQGEEQALEWIDAGLALLLRAKSDLRRAGGASRLVLELALVRFARVRQMTSLDAIAKRMEHMPASMNASPQEPRRVAAPTSTSISPSASSSASSAPRARTAAPRAVPAHRPAERSEQSESPRSSPQDETELYERFLEELEQRDRALAAVASGRAAPLRWSGQEFTLALGGVDFTELLLFDDPQNRRLMEESLRAVLGPNAQLILETGSSGRAPSSPRRADRSAETAPPVAEETRRRPGARPGASEQADAAAPKSSARRERPPHPLVDRTKKLFDGEEVE